ncbi:MAG: WD40 repeat domain-containing protein [Nitrosomonadales bacterium]|nr:WD40 repeat domain-containing protein [Nitrosomonadales bacterium]
MHQKNKSASAPLVFVRSLLFTMLLLSMTAGAQADDMRATLSDEVPTLTPKGHISLGYPNPWDFNKLIALSNDGRYLIDASETARNIRVWDWEKKEVAQRLLLNEGTPDMSDGKPHRGGLQFMHGGQNLVLTPDGRMVAACVSIPTKQPAIYETAAKARVWNLESGEVVANILALLRNVTGLGHDALLSMGCDAISFSPDGKYMAVLGNNAGLYPDEAFFAARDANFKAGKRPEYLSGIALYETKSWQLLRFIPVLESDPARQGKRPKLNSRILFSADSKQVMGAVFDQPPIPVSNKYNGEWIGSRIVRWDIETGAMLEEKATPNIGRPYVGVWWNWLPGGREVWWSTFTEAHFHQTREDTWECDAAANAPAFESDVLENCAYGWALAILDIETGKIKYLAPFKKNPPQTAALERELDSLTADISPDGVHLIIINDTSKTNTLPPENQISIIDVLNRETLRPEGRYSWSGASMRPIFNNDSRYFAIKALKRGASAMVFELPVKK